VEIVPESPADRAAVRRVNTLAFGQPNEADLVDALRDVVSPIVSLVAREGAEVVGHIFFTPVTVEPGAAEAGEPSATDRERPAHAAPWSAIALGPMAVLPNRQRQGIGSALVTAGLEACGQRGDTVVCVLGHPGFHPRSGFLPALPLGLPCEFPVPEEVFMVAELVAGSLGGRHGLVRYHPRFSTV
jgi:putative acetyltransferase